MWTHVEPKKSCCATMLETWKTTHCSSLRAGINSTYEPHPGSLLFWLLCLFFPSDLVWTLEKRQAAVKLHQQRSTVYQVSYTLPFSFYLQCLENFLHRQLGHLIQSPIFFFYQLCTSCHPRTMKLQFLPPFLLTVAHMIDIGSLALLIRVCLMIRNFLCQLWVAKSFTR